MGLPTLVKKFTRNAEDFGTFASLQKTGLFLLKPLYVQRIYRIYGIDLEKFVPKLCPDIGLAFRLVDQKDEAIIAQIEKMEEWLQGSIVAKLANQGLCLVALDKNRVAGFNLIGVNDVFIPLLCLRRKLARDEAWSEQITVHKDFRKHGLGAELRYRIFAELKSRGFRKLYGGALRSNLPSLKLAQKVGFEFLTDVYFRKVFNFKSWRYQEVEK